MTTCQILTAVGVALLASVGSGQVAAAPIIITFDDLVGNTQLVPSGYGGIDWFESWNHYGRSQPPYNPHSEPQRVYQVDGFGTFDAFEAQFAFVTPDQYFSGAWFAGYRLRGGGIHGDKIFVHFNLYNGDQLVAKSSALTPSAKPTFLSSGYRGPVDRVGVFSNGSGWWVMDDVTYGADAPAPVPEPASIVLLGSGLVSLRSLRRRA